MLSGVRELRLTHASTAVFPGEPIVAMLGIDNVSAVPEPGAAALLLTGLLALAGWRRRPARRSG